MFGSADELQSIAFVCESTVDWNDRPRRVAVLTAMITFTTFTAWAALSVFAAVWWVLILLAVFVLISSTFQ